MNNKLLKINTAGLKEFYIVDESIDKAMNHLDQIFRLAKYGFSEDRKIISIEIIAEELYNFPETMPNLSSGNRLILPESCKLKWK